MRSCLLALALLAACERQAPPSHADAGPLVLTDRTVAAYAASLEDAVNPFDFLLRGDEIDPATIGARGAEMDAFARRHGFAGSEELLVVHARVVVYRMLELASAAGEMQRAAIVHLEDKAGDATLPEAERARYREEAELARRDLAELDGRKRALSPGDRDVIARHKPRIDAAMKRYRPE